MKLNANKGGPPLPQSANIFSNISTLFSGLSHENKIIQLEKFLKDISEIEGMNNSAAYKNFFEIDQILNKYRDNKNSNITKENLNKTKQINDDKNSTNANSNKNNNTKSSFNAYNNTGGYSSNISNDASNLNKGHKRIVGNKLSEFNNDFFDSKVINNKETKNVKYQIKKIN